MSDTIDAGLTIDQAVEMMEDDDHATTSVVPYSEPSTLDYWGGDEIVEADGVSDNRSLTLDEAAEIDLADDTAQSGEVSTLVKNAHRPVALVDGKLVSLHDLVNGYAANRDHEVIRSRFDDEARAIRQASQAIVDSAWSLADYLVKNLPAEPSANLAIVDPASYTALKAEHDAAHSGVGYLLEQARNAQAVADELSAQRHNERVAAENVKLVDHFPECGTAEGREQFFNAVRDVAYACGFSEGELQNTVDHRLFRLAHLATAGKRASGAKSKPHRKRRRNQSHSPAMQRLAELGTLEAALACDFD